jgi:hypothetical protein
MQDQETSMPPTLMRIELGVNANDAGQGRAFRSCHQGCVGYARGAAEVVLCGQGRLTSPFVVTRELLDEIWQTVGKANEQADATLGRPT